MKDIVQMAKNASYRPIISNIFSAFFHHVRLFPPVRLLFFQYFSTVYAYSILYDYLIDQSMVEFKKTITSVRNA